LEIQTVHGRLAVIKKVFNNDVFEINVCKYENVKEDNLYTVIILKEADIIHRNIEMFSSLRSNNKFIDFIECFSKDSCLYITFAYYEEFPINFQEVSQLPLIQRVAIVKQILSLIIVLDMPKSILYDALSNNNVNLDSSGKVYFNYFIKNVDRYDNIKDKEVIKRIGLVFINVFNEELSINCVDGLKNLINDCENGVHTEIIDIYSDYIALNENFIKSLDLKNEKKLSIFRKILDKTLVIFKKIIPIFTMLALCIGIVYLIIILTQTNKEEQPTKINAIGTENIYK